MLSDTYDRLYGRLDLPDSARRLAATCPLLLRLREVRMPNIPFVTYPSFANVSRYEHSLGVAHLAWRWARKNGLSDERGEALVLASLYHDAATPAFSHLFEEFLSRRGFDHESALADVLGARPAVDGGSYAQVFVGRPPRLRDELARMSSREPLLTSTGVASIAVGEHPLGRAVHGDLDLDNIDNVIRATTAMGLSSDRWLHPYEVAEALVYEDGEITLARDSADVVGRWRAMRRLLYRSILDSKPEFLAQATIKWAIEECYRDDTALSEPNAWCLTEPELLFGHLRQHKYARLLIDRVRLGTFPDLLFSAWVDDLTPLLGADSQNVTEKLCSSLADVWSTDAYVSFNVDKRERRIDLPSGPVRTLFDIDLDLRAEPAAVPSEEGPRPTRARKPGLLGGIGMRLRAVPGRSGSPNRDEALGRTRDVLEDAFGSGVSRLAGTWLGARK
jgi:hypothetical protein